MPNLIETFFDDEIYDFSQRPLFMAIGTFDGVHLGHGKIISTAIDHAKANGGVAVVYTFRPHPTVITAPNAPKPMLCDFEEKYKLLESYGLASIIEQKFDGQFSQMTPSDFLKFLGRKFPTLRGICVGENFRFGHNRLGDTQTLADCSKEHGIGVTAVPSLTMGGEQVSSSHIRELIKSGNVGLANSMLGRGGV